MSIKKYLLFSFCLFTVLIKSQDSLFVVNDSAIKLYEANLALLYQESMSNYNTSYIKDSNVNHSIKEIKKRINYLNHQTPFDFNSSELILNYIKTYVEKRKKLTAKMFNYGKFYFPIFEEQLIKHELPLELKYLPIVESALNPKAKSRAGAVGLWQFMPRTGKMMGLEISSFIDERKDPLLSTEAACLYLKKLFTVYEDWNLALAAYNAGPGNINKAIRRSGGETDYWKVRPFLPKETQNYIPAFTAVNYMMNYNYIGGQTVKELPFVYYDVDTLLVSERISFETLEEWLSYDLEKISFLNPSYTEEIIPKSNTKHSLCLPSFLISDFLMQQDSIYHYSSKTININSFEEKSSTSKFYIIKEGDTIWDIAEKYKGISVADIKNYNKNVDISNVKKGDKIIISIH
jgi:membrane-bound lytic murein transglycosylase D